MYDNPASRKVPKITQRFVEWRLPVRPLLLAELETHISNSVSVIHWYDYNLSQAFHHIQNHRYPSIIRVYKDVQMEINRLPPDANRTLFPPPERRGTTRNKSWFRRLVGMQPLAIFA